MKNSIAMVIGYVKMLSMSNKSERVISIYELFDETGKCRYIGQTSRPMARRSIHFCKGGLAHKMNWTFKGLRETDIRNCNRLEEEIGMSYKNRGECDLSKSFGKLHRDYDWRMRTWFKTAEKEDYKISPRILSKINWDKNDTTISRELGISRAKVVNLRFLIGHQSKFTFKHEPSPLVLERCKWDWSKTDKELAIIHNLNRITILRIRRHVAPFIAPNSPWKHLLTT